MAGTVSCTKSFLFVIFPLGDVVPDPRQRLDLSSRGTTSSGSGGNSAGRTWCFTPAKALIFRLGAPRRRARPGIWWAGRGASPPSKPWSFVAGHHVAEAGRAFGEPNVVLHPRQSLDPSLRGTMSPRPARHSAGRTWCLTPVKALIFRLGAPRRRTRPVIPRAWPLAMKKPAYGKQSLLDRCR